MAECRKMISRNLGPIFTFMTLMSRLLLPTATGTNGDRDRRQTQIVAKKRTLANNLALARFQGAVNQEAIYAFLLTVNYNLVNMGCYLSSCFDSKCQT